MSNPIPEWLQQRVVDCLLKQAKDVWKKYLRKKVEHVWNYKKRLKELGKAVEELKKEKERVQRKSEEDDRLFGKQVHHVQVWLRQVDEIISQYENLVQDNKQPAGGLLPLANPKERYRKSKDAERIKDKVGELQKEKQDTISYWRHAPSSVDVAFSNPHYVSILSCTNIVFTCQTYA
ncbi:hypothetical protein PIB30_015688 [Stylosanthes scabra]|uniref:Uncharacterized protein n=1 Tax=Stylosanthes scabra TaxID=79078 RepID=A0ABU6U6G1_9FABA|nr:hypothetical protein [Stylosanthes scabra]